MFLQGRAQFLICLSINTAAPGYDIIDTAELRLVMTKALARHAFYAITCNRTARRFQ